MLCRSWCLAGSTYLSPLPGPMKRTRWQKQGRTPTQTLRWRVHNTPAAASCQRPALQPWPLPPTGPATGGHTPPITLILSTPPLPKTMACSESAPSESWLLALLSHKDTVCTFISRHNTSGLLMTVVHACLCVLHSAGSLALSVTQGVARGGGHGRLLSNYLFGQAPNVAGTRTQRLLKALCHSF